MKKTVLTVLLVAVAVLFSTASFAQTGFLRLGIKGGTNINKIQGKAYNEEFNFNYYLGAFLQLNLSPGFGIQPEVLFSQSTAKTGSNFSDTYNNLPNNKHVNLNYLNIPILANISIGGPHVKLQLGPQYSILMNKDESLVQNGKDAFKNGEFAAVGGLWIQLPLGLNISGRYIVGLSDIGDLRDQNKWKNQAIQAGIGFTF